MTDDSKKPGSKDKNDLTGIFETISNPSGEPDPFAFVEAPSETIESFESIDEIGMLDHSQATSTHEQETIFQTTAQTPVEETHESELFTAPPAFGETATSVMATSVMDGLKEYSEQSQTLAAPTTISVPFHLHISGNFGPFERDKLLLFITENPLGIASADLHLQIQAGRVLFPRISEFAAIKLIQDLRDSGLQFQLKPSQRDDDEPARHAEVQSFHFKVESSKTFSDLPPILPASAQVTADYEVIDTVQYSQFLKSEIIEAEKSELFQEVLERMTTALKQKAKNRGAHAISQFSHRLVSLRLPSQYQVEISAVLLRKKS